MSDKKHLTEEGYNKILEMYGTMNKNRSFEEKFNYLNEKIFSVNKEWLIGFIEAEGTFSFYIEKLKGLDTPVPKVLNTLEIAQATHERPLLKSIIQFLGIGYLKPKKSDENLESIKSLRSVSRLVCNSPDKVISFLGLEPFITLKQKDYNI